MNKRWSAAITLIVLLLSMFCTAFSVSAEPDPAELQLKISNEMIPGSSVTVEVQLKNNPGTTGLALDLEYDDAVLTLTDAKTGPIVDENALVVWDQEKAHRVSLATATVTPAVGDGAVLILTFTVRENAAAGDHSFKVSVVKNDGVGNATDANVQHYDLAPAEKTFKVLDYVWGDADGDHAVSITDVQRILQWRVGKEKTLNDKGADANRDCKVTLADALLLLQWQAGLVEWDPFGETTPPLNMA